jgi:hypothetical protein
MRTRYFTDFHVSRSEGERFRAYIKDLDLIEFWNEPHNERALPYLAATLYGDDPRLHKLRDLLTREGIEWSERRECIYSVKELREFPLLRVVVDRKPLDEGGPELGTTYDLSSACPMCGCGAVQTSPLMLPLSSLPNRGRICQAAHGEVLVSEAVRDSLRRHEVSGLELRQVHFYRNNEPLAWWQIISSYVMPRMSSTTRGITTDETDQIQDDGMVIRALPPCPRCRRDGRYDADEPCQIEYSTADLDIASLPDIVHTWESFGRSGINTEESRFSRYYSPLILVQSRVFDILLKCHIRGLRFDPVRIVD